MGGDLQYQDPPDGIGASFVFWFTAGKTEPEVAPDIGAPLTLADRRILLIEPNPLHAALLRTGLESACRSVSVIQNLEVFDPNVRREDALVLIMSMGMSDDMEAQLLAARERIGDASLVVLHAGGGERPFERAKGLADLWLEKPIQLPALIESLRGLEFRIPAGNAAQVDESSKVVNAR